VELKQYARQIEPLALYPEAGQGSLLALCYTSLGLAGEAGEVANQIKKVVRDDAGKITPERQEKLAAELGDVAWYFVRLCEELRLDPEGVLADNVSKLNARKRRGTLSGDGDFR